jgi:hypothetical protein
MGVHDHPFKGQKEKNFTEGEKKLTETTPCQK